MTPPPIWFGTDESPPGPGNVMVLYYHHDGESHWCSPEQVRKRVEDILNGGKPEEEWGKRMENMMVVPYGKWWESKAITDARAVYNSVCSDAEAVCTKAISDAEAVCDRARSDAWAVYAKARSDAWAVYDKACSDARAVYVKACSALWGEQFNAETWVAERFG